MTIFELGIMRRLDEGRLRYDGVTDYQAKVLAGLIQQKLIEIVGIAGPGPKYYEITDKGAAALTRISR